MHPSFFQLGRFHLPVYGICAAIGLVGVLLLSQVTARLVRLDPDKVWDAVVAIALAALVFSRALLVAGSFRFFLQQPMLVLALPTVNDTGLLLTAAFGVGYLRWKHLSLMPFSDALAPCGVLLWAFLSLGRWAEGTRDGMPARFGVWPVELLSLFAAIALCVGLLRMTRLVRPPGRICAYGLATAGLAIFAIDLVRLPADLVSDLGQAGILDPVQWLGLAMMVAGAGLAIAVPAGSQYGTADAV